MLYFLFSWTNISVFLNWIFLSIKRCCLKNVELCLKGLSWILSHRYPYSWEECCGCRTLQECGNAHRHVTPHRRSPWEAWRSVCAFALIWIFKEVLYLTTDLLNVPFTSTGDATVTISHRYTPKEQLRHHTQIADIVVAAAGSCQLWEWTLVLRSLGD